MRLPTNTLRLLAILCLVAGALTMIKPAQASVRFGATAVSDSGADNSLSNSNTGRKIIASPEGNIYAIYHSPTQGLRFARSLNEGNAFQPSISITIDDVDAEIAVDSQGIIFISWIKDGEVFLSRSADLGATFSLPVHVGFAAAESVHMAVNNPYVYILEREGRTLFANSNKGIGDFTVTGVDSQRIYSDVHVDPYTSYVYVQTDDPNVLYFVSSDHGASFSPSIRPDADIYFSTSAISATPLKKYLYVAGGTFTGITSAAIRVNLSDNSSISMPVTATDGDTERSLAADELGNVVSGFRKAGEVRFEVSNDYGQTFGDPITVDTSLALNLAIDPIHHTVLALYEQDGSIFLTTYANLLLAEIAPDASTGGGGSSPWLFLPPRANEINFSLNNGSPTTDSSLVQLAISAGSDIASMAISNAADFPGASLQPLASSAAWQLCDSCQAGQTYTVYLKLYTASGQSILLTRSIRYEAKSLSSSPANPTPTLTTKPISSAKPFTFIRDLRIGSRGSDVRRLQQYLNSHGFVVAKSGPGSVGQESEVFGPATRNAVMRFQAAHAAEILAPSGLRSPSGIFGSATRAYANSHP